MRVAQIRAAAYGILVVALIDLVAMAVFLGMGWIDPATANGGTAQFAIPATFLILMLALVGSAAVIFTTRNSDPADIFELSCWECGELPKFEIAFCHSCGAGA